MPLTDEQLEQARAILEKERQRKLSFARDYEYDGVFGWPPSWTPTPFLIRFRDYRDWFLDVCGFSHEQVLRFIESLESDDEEIIMLHRGPKGPPFSTHEWLDKIGYLAHLKWCASLPPEEGLLILAGELAVHGYKMQQGPKNPRGKDVFRKVLEDTYLMLGGPDTKVTARMVFDNLPWEDRKYDFEIQEIDEDDKVYWRARGKEGGTSFKQISNRLTEIRQQYQKDPSK
jgi:hypothetical protein